MASGIYGYTRKIQSTSFSPDGISAAAGSVEKKKRDAESQGCQSREMVNIKRKDFQETQICVMMSGM